MVWFGWHFIITFPKLTPVWRHGNFLFFSIFNPKDICAPSISSMDWSWYWYKISGTQAWDLVWELNLDIRGCMSTPNWVNWPEFMKFWVLKFDWNYFLFLFSYKSWSGLVGIWLVFDLKGACALCTLNLMHSMILILIQSIDLKLVIRLVRWIWILEDASTPSTHLNSRDFGPWNLIDIVFYFFFHLKHGLL